uniref:TP53 regulated inhibitor of apoptosis 1 n=1 Tax=Trichuris muris TaxID=70415 RepID=A0A5S6QV39_TRIMR
MERMNSISPKCNELKHLYDTCFNEWFSEKFLKGDSEDVCQPLFLLYQECIRKALVEQKVDQGEIDRNIIGSDKDKGNSNLNGAK